MWTCSLEFTSFRDSVRLLIKTETALSTFKEQGVRRSQVSQERLSRRLDESVEVVLVSQLRLSLQAKWKMYSSSSGVYFDLNSHDPCHLGLISRTPSLHVIVCFVHSSKVLSLFARAILGSCWSSR